MTVAPLFGLMLSQFPTSDVAVAVKSNGPAELAKDSIWEAGAASPVICMKFNAVGDGCRIAVGVMFMIREMVGGALAEPPVSGITSA